MEVIYDSGTDYFDEIDLEMQRNAKEMIARPNVNAVHKSYCDQIP